MNKPLIVLTAALVGLGANNLSLASGETLEKTFDVASGGTLYIDSDAGSIEVEAHSKEQVEVVVYKHGKYEDEFEVQFEQRGNDVLIEGDKKSVSSWGFSRGGVRYVIKVPDAYNLDLETGGGSIDIENVSGEVDVSTSGGSIGLGEITGDVVAKTSGGSIRVEDVAGNIRAHTSGGSIKAKLSQQITDDCKLTTSGGSITAYLTPDIKIDLDASTSGGSVRSAFDVDGRVKRTSIRGSINGGGPELTLKTSGGSVSVKEI